MVRTVATHRENLAEALKRARLAAGFKTHGALAGELHVDRSVITRAEGAIQPVPSDALLVSWADATGASLDELTNLSARCRSGSPEWFMPYASAESQATMLRCWSPLVVPGLLQTEQYAHAVLAAYPHSAERLAELVTARMERQRVLDRAHLVAVIGMATLPHCLGSPQVMADQMAHLVTVAEQPNIALHVVPDGANHGVWAGLEIASHGGTATVCLTTALDDVTSTAGDQVDSAVLAFERVMGAAMAVQDSLDCLRRYEGQWKEQI